MRVGQHLGVGLFTPRNADGRLRLFTWQLGQGYGRRIFIVKKNDE
ncbi:MAG: hypothetical protein CM1200mP14_27410 [Gammaproteobacteria bacterium]|nr:MAG: hypothetical protein CM1200mP14_27410 [Gammaproteobacteria bacterium]